jgi:hypothetical protein
MLLCTTDLQMNGTAVEGLKKIICYLLSQGLLMYHTSTISGRKNPGLFQDLNQ